MNTVYKSEQAEVLSDTLNIPYITVKKVLNGYIERVRTQVFDGLTVKFLNICYLENRYNDTNSCYHETLAYISEELGKDIGVGDKTVYGILSSYQEIIEGDVKKMFPYVIHGLFKIKLDEYDSTIKLRLNKSKSLPSDVRVHAISSFKKKVESV